ncbi:hypothetical protein [Tengunoibacter tsumagoiensis]|uniref:Uncharacterized protein n=1 Tax=Tengunoibacter tsumagoiensis TaxID=2014871 RepID=A0A402A031_9CHLR|nr:hypothetical protein [Tengunoibacter tsumagoiensis]GCE12453.1 hypothetical protein KTT_23120 [Tengunoibacter tsumagoiensis]
MTEQHVSIALTDEQIIAWYQHHTQVWQGYALALALQAGLSPTQAARIFVDPWLMNTTHSIRTQANPQILEQQARQTAEVLSLTYGEDHIHLKSQNENWLITITDIDLEPLERYGVSYKTHIEWIQAQLQLVCEPKGINCSVQMDQKSVSLRFSLLEPQYHHLS